MRRIAIGMVLVLAAAAAGAAVLPRTGLLDACRDCPAWATLRLDSSLAAVPTWQEASTFPEFRAIEIEGRDGFAFPAWTGQPRLEIPGKGTPEDPYVIEGLHVRGHLTLRDTDACVIIRGNYFGGMGQERGDASAKASRGKPMADREWRPALLRLDWNGPCIHVHGNHVGALRVNGNDVRTGYATGGILEGNAIASIPQLRHFDGIFARNTVGLRPPDMPMHLPWDPGVANVDGFNQGEILENTFHAGVELDFHGHHHGSGFFAPGSARKVHSHYHGADHDRHLHEDHADRWTSVRFADNVVHGRLRYEDLQHEADDRVAASESIRLHGTDASPLNAPHRHHTRVEIDGNVVQGTLVVEVFNAPGVHLWDEPRYPVVERFGKPAHCEEFWTKAGLPHGDMAAACSPLNPTWDIVPHPRFGQDVSRTVRSHLGSDGTLRIAGNVVEASEPSGAAMRLAGVRDADVEVVGNTLSGARVGIALVAWLGATATVEGNVVTAAECAVVLREARIAVDARRNDFAAERDACQPRHGGWMA